MEILIMQLFNGISVSSILLLAAVGLAITFGLMGVINMAHGEFIMIGAYTTYVVQCIFQKYVSAAYFDVYCLVAIIASFIIAGAFGLILERLIIRHLYSKAADSLLVTWGVSLILQQLARSIFGSPNVGVKAPVFLENNLKLTGVIVLPYKRLFILIIAISCLVGVYVWMYKTRQGRNIRAVMQNRKMAASLGVNTKLIDAGTFAIGSGLAGIAGCTLSWIGAIGPTLGTSYIVDTFMTVVVGGVGSIIGTIIGSSFIGIGGTAFEYLTDASMGKVLVFICVIIVLQFKPKGIFTVNTRALDD
jgi:urea transport system permease protein